MLSKSSFFPLVFAFCVSRLIRSDVGTSLVNSACVFRICGFADITAPAFFLSIPG